jgi:uncharacterized membrane protein
MLKDPPAQFLRRTFLTGLLILIPLFVTYVLIAFLFNLLAGSSAPVINALFRLLSLNRYAWADPLVPFINLVLSLAVIFLLGLFGTNILGRRILHAIDALILRLPLVNRIYGAVKQVVETFQGPHRSFQRVVLVQFPSKGFWSMGFVATEHHDTMNLTSSRTLLTIFIPTTPNVTSGYLVMVSPEDVIEVDYSVEEAFKFIVSLGIIGKDFAPLKSPFPAALAPSAPASKPSQS